MKHLVWSSIEVVMPLGKSHPDRASNPLAEVLTLGEAETLDPLS